VLRGPADAAAALYEMLGDPDEDLIAFFLCDAEHRVVTAEFLTATRGDVPLVLDALLDIQRDGTRLHLVLALMGPTAEDRLAPDEVAALAQLWRQCDGGNLDLLDVLVVNSRGWESVVERSRLGGATGHDRGGDERW
jgi:hypothetical protein